MALVTRYANAEHRDLSGIAATGYERISIAPDPDPRCAPLRFSDCPACGVKTGKRCIGIDRDDTVHIERVWQCMARQNGVL